MPPNSAGERYERLRPDASLGLWRDACLPLNFSYAHCRACEQACPVAALRVDSDWLSLTDACIGCGRCAAACPTGALGVGGCTVPASVARDADVVHVDCWKVPRSDSPPHALRVPCLGGLAVSQWLALVLVARGRPVIALDRGWCSRCPAGGGEHPAQANLKKARALLADIGMRRSDLPVLLTQRLPIATMPARIPAADEERAVSRRSFFSRLAREATATVVEVQTADPAAGERRPAALKPGALRVPERDHRLALLTVLARRTGAPLPRQLLPAIAIGPNCCNHRVCAALCPTGALKSYQDENASGVWFDAGACIRCGCCEQGCPEKALRLMPPGSAANRAQTVLTRHAQHECDECGTLFSATGDSGICPACHKSREAFSVFLAARH